MFDLDHPWFRPLHRRVLTCALALGWGAFELFTGSPGWAILFLAVGAYAVFRLFLAFDPKDPP